MAKTKAEKEAEVREVTAGLKDAKSVVFADLSSLKVNESNELRHRAREQEIGIRVSKKSLLRLAVKKAGLPLEEGELQGSVSLLLGHGDELGPARLFKELKKRHKDTAVFGGVLESRWLSSAEVQAVADLPSKDELIAKVVGSVRAPLSGLVGVLQGNLRGLITALNAIKDSKSA